MPNRRYWIHALTPVHVGVGLGSGFIDLPVMREKITGWPLIPGSAVKGVRADQFASLNPKPANHEEIRVAAFGQADESSYDDQANSGALVFTDARLVCLPVRSYYGTFAWLTSPLALKRLKRDADGASLALADGPDATVDEGNALVPQGAASALVEKTLKSAGKIYLEDLDLTPAESPEAATWADRIACQIFSGDSAWQAEFRKRFVIVPDNTFNFFCETGCEVNARVRIDSDKKTVARGALWYEESLPAESILSGLVWCDRVFHSTVTADVLVNTLCTHDLALQIGGKATVGKGRVRCLFAV